MNAHTLTRKLIRKQGKRSLGATLKNGSRVVVMGGGPAGSLFRYFLLTMAERSGFEIEADIYELRDFSQPAPQGCNLSAGVISEFLVQHLAADGINLPPTVVQRAVDSYVMHTDVGSLRPLSAEVVELRNLLFEHRIPAEPGPDVTSQTQT